MKCIFTKRLAARVGALVLSSAATLCMPTFVQGQDAKPCPPVIAGYLPAWSAAPETIAALPANALTHILYAFGAITEDGRAALGDPCRDIGDCGPGQTGEGNFAALAALKDRYPHLKVLISLGGWTGSRRFSDAASTPDGRERLAASAIDLFMVTHGDVFDGIDVDWEYPVEGGLPENSQRPEDRENFTLLIEEIRRQLDRVGDPVAGRRPLLTIATTGSPWFMRNIDVKALAHYVDWIGVMTYDYAAGASVTGFNSPLFRAIPGDPEAPSVASSVEAYLAAGAPPDSLVLGLPFYGRAYQDVDPGPLGDGLFQRSGSTAFPRNEDTIPYEALVAADPVSQGYRHHRHAIARVPWLYHPERHIWISYDDIDSLRDKAAFVRLRGLRGVMIWDLSGDDGGLIEAVRDSLVK